MECHYYRNITFTLKVFAIKCHYYRNLTFGSEIKHKIIEILVKNGKIFLANVKAILAKCKHLEMNNIPPPPYSNKGQNIANINTICPIFALILSIVHNFNSLC